MAAWDPFGEARHAARAASLGCDLLDPVSMDLVSWTAVTATKHGKVVGWLHTDKDVIKPMMLWIRTIRFKRFSQEVAKNMGIFWIRNNEDLSNKDVRT